MIWYCTSSTAASVACKMASKERECSALAILTRERLITVQGVGILDEKAVERPSARAPS